MKISVLMSVYTKEKPEYLKQAIESIVNQTKVPNQIVVIKDGKITDELEKVLYEYKNKFPEIIDIFEIEKHSGLGNALKYGVTKCKNEYIARMDTDDISVLNRFEEQIKYIEKNPNVDILGGYIEEYDEEMKNLLSVRKVPILSENINKTIKKQSPFNHGTVIMRKEAILKAGNYNSTRLEDYDLWARMIKCKCNMHNIDKVLCKARSGKSLYKRRSGLKYIKAIVEIEQNLNSYGLISKYRMIINIIQRSIVAICPVKIKEKIYPYIIRKIKV